MKKYMLDLRIVENVRLHERAFLLRLTAEKPLPAMVAGQFVQVRIDGSPQTFLRRPISVNYVDKQRNTLWLLVQIAGDGTRWLSERLSGDIINVILPLGNGFTIPFGNTGDSLLLIGGGVGVAPLLFLGETLKSAGFKPIFLLGGRSKNDILQLPDFQRIGTIFITTEDGSAGEKGFVTNHSILREGRFGKIYTCGPKPMMLAVAHFAKENGIDCEVSLENMMACGIGACLCCVEKTVKGNLCVCIEGPVFNINQLTWQI
ncbi:MAG: dihydroorotate dehydrogenase electron transfer subunit [Tannerella sp.]|nr:dihydroorotate dehydrogenase electron transfer subunit [Tannerella sp.]